MNRPVAPEPLRSRPPLDFLVRIERGTAKKSGFCGTGFLISPRHVLTCAHVVLGRMPAEEDTHDALVDPGNILVRRVDEFTGFLRGTLIGVGLPDAALIVLEESVPATPLRLITNVRAEQAEGIAKQRPRVAGFSGAHPNTLVESEITRIVSWLGAAEPGLLLEVQIEGGRGSGMSGSPVLVEVSGAWACLGMLYLGGEGAATSRFMLPGDLLKMMDRHGVDYPAPLNAGDVFASDAHKPIAAPALPSNYLPRPNVFLPLRSTCLEERTDKPIGLTGLKGMGGVGKTVMARALCHDPETQSRFPDGVLWVTVGRKPSDLAGLIRNVLASLQVPPPATDSLEAACALLRTAMQGRACLIILDDIWSASHVLPFRVNAPKSCLLFTTRNAGVVNSLGAEEYAVDTLAREEALELLAKWAHLPVETLPDEAYVIVEECGRLPLSLAIVGSLLRARGHRWGHVLQQLRSTVVQRADFVIDDYASASLWRVVSLSLDELPPAAREHYLELGVFREGAAIAEAALRPLWNMDSAGIADLVDSYVDLSLATRVSGHEIVLHDLLVDYVREHGPDLRSLHESLLRGYERMCTGPWHTGPNDGYFFQGLGYHLLEAGKAETLCSLLLDFNWLQAKLVATDVYSTINDFNMVSERAELDPVRDAIRLSIHVLLADPSQLYGHLLSRLTPAEFALIKGLSRRPAVGSARPVLVPLSQSLVPPGGELEVTLTGHSAAIIGAGLDGDGQKAVTASEDATVKVWNLETGAVTYTLRHDAPCTAVAMARVGWRAVSSSTDGCIKLWDVIAGDEIRAVTSSHQPRCIAINATGSLAVSGSEEGYIQLWDLHTGRMIRSWQAPGAPVVGVDMTADGGLIVSVSKTGNVDLWNASGFHLKSLREAGSASGAVAITNDGSRIAFATGGTGVVCDATGDSSKVFGDPSAHPINALTFTERGRRIVTGSDDAILGVWSAATGNELKRLPGHGGAIKAVAATESGDRYISAGFDRTLRVWKPAGVSRPPACAHLDIAYGVSLATNGRFAVSASGDGTIGLWRPVGGRKIRSFLGHEGPVNSICIGFYDGIAASASDDCTVRVWDLRLQAEKWRFSEPEGAVQSVAVAARAPVIAASSWDFRIRLWDAESGALLHTLGIGEMPIRSLALSDDGTLLLSASDDQTVVVWDTKTGEQKSILQGHNGSVNSVALAASAGLAASASDDATVRLWDLNSGSEQHRWTCSGVLYGVATALDGRLVVAAGDRSVIVFDTASRAEVCRFTGDTAFTSCAATPDGKYIAAGDTMGAVHFFRLYRDVKRLSDRT
jgi:WD40 repeat protein